MKVTTIFGYEFTTLQSLKSFALLHDIIPSGNKSVKATWIEAVTIYLAAQNNVIEMIVEADPIASLNFQFKGEGEELLSLVADADVIPACEIIDQSMTCDRLYSVIDSLVESDKITDEELNVLVRFYGLHGVPIENLSQQSLGNEKERARLQKLKNRVIAQLRTPPVRRQLAHLI